MFSKKFRPKKGIIIFILINVIRTDAVLLTLKAVICHQDARQITESIEQFLSIRQGILVKDTKIRNLLKENEQQKLIMNKIYIEHRKKELYFTILSVKTMTLFTRLESSSIESSVDCVLSNSSKKSQWKLNNLTLLSRNVVVARWTGCDLVMMNLGKGQMLQQL